MKNEIKKVRCKLGIGFLFTGFYYNYKIHEKGKKYSVEVPLGYDYFFDEEEFKMYFYSVVEDRKIKLEKLKKF